MERAFTRPLRGTRRFTPAEPALAGPLDSARAVHSRVSWRSSPLTPLSRSPLVTPASQPSVHLPDPPKMTSSRVAVKADAWFPSPETPSTGADSSAYPLAEVALLRGRLESLRPRRYAPSIEDDFVRQRRLVLTLLAKDAREVFPRRLAPAREPLSSACAISATHIVGAEARTTRFLPLRKDARATPVRALYPPPREVCDLCPRSLTPTQSGFHRIEPMPSSLA